MLKKASIVAALVMALSSGVMAAGEIEQTWKQQIPSAHLQYEKGHGNVAAWAGMERSMNEQWNAASEKSDNAGISFGYGLMNNLEVRGFIVGERSENMLIPNSEAKNLAYMGSVKGQIYNANGLMVGARGAVSHDSVNGTSYDLDAYSNKVVNEKVTVYNNAGVTINPSKVVASMTNGMQYLFNNRNAVKVAVDTVYDNQAGQFTPYLSAALKTKISEKTNNLIQANATTGEVNLNHVIESQVTPSLLVRGQADMQVTNAADNRISGNIGVDAEKQMGIVTLKAGVAHNLKANDWRIATVKAGADVDVTKNLKLSIDAANSKFYYPEREGKNDTSVNVALNYEL